MKKLLVLLLVLAMTSSASAILQISVNGDPEPIDSEIWITEPSQELTLDIWNDEVLPLFTPYVWQLVCDTSLGDVSGGVSTHVSTVVTGPTEGTPEVIPPVGMEGIWGSTTHLDFAQPAGLPAGTLLADQFIFHCPGPGDVTIYLMDAPENAPPTMTYDAVVIHQIPEPMTVALLGLGGLFLLRRRK